MMRVRKISCHLHLQEKISPEMAEKLALLEKLGITLDDLEKLFKSRLNINCSQIRETLY